MVDSAQEAFTAAVVTVSDRGATGERKDRSGPAVREFLEAAGLVVVTALVVPDDRLGLERIIVDLCAGGHDLVVTTGGTGVSPRDVTPEATRAVIDREVPGMAEAMRAESFKVTPHAMLSRAVCGFMSDTLIINLPGSPRAALECLEVVMPAVPHALELAKGRVSDCADEPG